MWSYIFMYYLNTTMSVYGKFSMRGMLRSIMQYDKKMSDVFVSKHTPNAVLSIHKSTGGALSGTVYCI